MLAIVSEIAGTIYLKISTGFSKPVPTTACIIFYLIAFLLMGKSMSHIPIATVYGIWSGVGIVGTLIISKVLFKEPINFYSYLGSFLIIVGIILVKKSQEA